MTEHKTMRERLTDLEEIRRNDVASDIAIMEIQRFLLSQILYREDSSEMHDALAKTDRFLIANIQSRDLTPNADDQTATYVKEAACRYVTDILASIKHPSEKNLQ